MSGDRRNARPDAESARADGMTWNWDMAAGTVSLSPPLLAMLGLSGERFPGTLDALIELLHPDDRANVRTEMSTAVIESRSFRWHARIPGPDGGQRILLSEGGPGRAESWNEVSAVSIEIASRRWSEPAARHLERRLSHIMAESPGLVAIKDLRQRYLVVNEDVRKLAGLPEREILGQRASEIFPVQGPRIEALCAEALAHQRTLHEDLLVPVGGEMRVFHLIVFPLVDEAGAPVEVCTMATDVTDARRQQTETRRRQEADDLITSALRQRRIIALTQPIIKIADGREVSQELLVRLMLPHDGGLLQPGAFLPDAERFGLVQDIDLFMLDRALGLSASRANSWVQVNLSSVTLGDARAREAIITALANAPDTAPRVIFEITETAASATLDAAGAFADTVTELGGGLALDDFGTGFASFTYLRRLPLRYLKIDRSFVSDLASSPEDLRVVSSIIDIAAQFGLATIAEGVEDVTTLRLLGDLGADYAQGYYLGHPALLRS